MKMPAMKQNNSDHDRSIQVYSALSVGVVCLVIGLPLWWKTTEVYRVSLPYSDISSLTDSKIYSTVDVEVISLVKEIDLAALSKKLTASLVQDGDIILNYRVSVQEATAAIQGAVSASTNHTDLDQRLSVLLVTKTTKYTVLLLSPLTPVDLERPLIGRSMLSFFRYHDQDLNDLSREISSALKTVMVRESAIYRSLETSRRIQNMKPDKESMRAVKSHPGYDLTFTLISPQPDVVDVQWEIEDAINDYLKPLLMNIEKYAEINIKSQVLFYTGLLSRTKEDVDAKEFYFTMQDLPHVINPLEVRLGSHASNNPDLNFLVYVPSRDQHPLYIRDENGNKVASNSFLSPRWGGIYIYNVPPPARDTQLPIQISLDMKQVMEVFISQIRLLFNLQTQTGSKEVHILPPGNQALRQWEIVSWLHSRCIENLSTAMATLQSLAQLLGEISNIVINDEIGQEVHEALESIKMCRRFLRDGQLEAAFLESKKAIISSEKAFFDPSLLELLYFPEDQKFAIYVPLFLPISLPIMASLWQAVRWFKGKDKPKQD